MKHYIICIILIVMSCEKNNSVIMETEFGIIKIELYPKKAPISVTNFLKYVDENRYEDFHFYRTLNLQNQPNDDIKIEVIQGGLGFNVHPMSLDPIKHENTRLTGLRHINGSISMARIKPGSANSEIFICINNQPELDFGGKRNSDGQGFATFGKVIHGFEVLKRIHNQKNKNQILIDPIHVKFIK